MAVTKTIQFLPEVFRTDTNRKFLNATLDQLVSEPNLKKINGYIGRKLSPSYKKTDSYISETSKDRENYQLEPSIIIKNPVSDKIEFATTYTDILNKIKYYGGFSDNHNRLFENEYYTYNPKVDLDKLINFSQYYWLENGPDSVVVSASDVPLNYTFDVTYNSATKSYSFTKYRGVNNPIITLARGGTYNFNINEPGNEFYIQTKPGLRGTDPNFPNLSTREIFGVINNGADVGTVKFTVPIESAQVNWTSMASIGSVDYATSLAYRDVHGSTVEDLNRIFGGLDGQVTYLEGKRIIFINNELIDEFFWTDAQTVVTDGIVYIHSYERFNYDTTPIEPTDVIPFGKRNDVYQIEIYPDPDGKKRIVLRPVVAVDGEVKVSIISGRNNVKKEFYNREPGQWFEVPLISAPLTGLFYQSNKEASAAGFIQIIDIEKATIDPDTEIIGKVNYISPNGVVFTNGLKVYFDSTTSEPYRFNTYYVEGVGKSINLVLVNDLITPELNNDLTLPDYLTIKRNSIDRNAWSRSNRWFHSDIIQRTAEYNNNDVLYDQTLRAKRPIIEFDASLQLFNHGTEAKAPVDALDTSVTSSYIQIQGATVLVEDLLGTVVSGTNVINLTTTTTAGLTAGMKVTVISGTGELDEDTVIEAVPTAYQIVLDRNVLTSGNIKFRCSLNDSTDEVAIFKFGDDTLTLPANSRVIFSNDLNNEVRNKIFNFSIALSTEAPDALVYKAYLEIADDSQVDAGHTVVVKSGATGQKQWYYNGSAWKETQQKTSINQHPLFDIIDNDGVSFADASRYPGTTFIGTKIFSYKISSAGTPDSVLGIPLSYKNFVAQGDILFNNDYDQDSFSYLVAGGSDVVPVNSGFLQKNITRAQCSRENIWTINSYFSKQYQTYNFVYDGVTNLFPINAIPDVSGETPNIKVIVNSVPITLENFSVAKVVDRYAVLINPDLIVKDDAIFISIFNNTKVARDAYYDVPLNFDINSLNTNLADLTLGQMRNHLITLKNNSLDIIGDVPGSSNIRDLQYLQRGGSILQHSAPVIYAGLFLNHPQMNFVDSIKLATKEYSKFKFKFLELAASLTLNIQDISGSVDAILKTINSVKNESFPWYYSDMVPYGSENRVSLPQYTVLDASITSYEISSIFNDKVISDRAVLVYITRTIDGVTTKTLLVKDKDYYFDQSRPVVTFKESFNLLFGDKIDIVEYSTTDGCYVPETPTKLGLYPKFVPELFVDNTYRTPTTVIQGHDGSITPAFNDFRDQLLLELERRIYNNLKVTYDTNIFNIHDYLPGKFRVNDYLLSEFNEILIQGFLSWVGTNKIDYTNNDVFSSSDPFTWNYKDFKDIVNGESLPGSWRGVYRYFFDTDRPHTHPWEMLGFSEKPDYWDDRYGPAPYTGGNSILWSDLSTGYIHSGERQGFDVRFQRPNLAYFVPVDDAGNLRPPSEILVADFDSARAKVGYAAGDIGPVEAAWRRSSEYPFMIQMALALSKPAKYFALTANVVNYVRNNVTAQFNIVGKYQHITPTTIDVHSYADNGTLIRGAGYINWIRDHLKNLGILDAADIIRNNLLNLNVQLSYKMAGYTDKKYIELLAEQNSPSSVNDSVIIPDENYRIELYKGSPVNKISYSAVIVEKTVTGYSVTGYNVNDPYFRIIPILENNNSYNISVNNLVAEIYRDFQNSVITIPYGAEFVTKQELINFLVGYQKHLESQGFTFNDRSTELKEEKTWVLSAKEFLYWTSQGWGPGSILVVSPVSTSLQVQVKDAVVDEILNVPYGSRVLDVSFYAITKNNFTVFREDNVFRINSTNDQTIGFAEFDLVQYEHLLVLDNRTVFQDIIYVPELGNRQYRLKLVGHKTANWTGVLELPGFVYNSGSFDEWRAGQDYRKGSIVKYKSNYYTALQEIAAADQFQTANWKNIQLTELKSGMVNNFATNAQQSLEYYDINSQPVNESIQLFSNGLIGFRNRSYFTNLGIDPTTQSKFYQGFIKQKGTFNSLTALKGAVFSNLDTGIDVYENWAVRVGEYGATEVNQFVEVVLDEAQFNSNPATLQFINPGDSTTAGIPAFSFSDLYKISGDFDKNIFKAESKNEPSAMRPLPVAGFVNIDDIDVTIFNLNDFEGLTPIVNQIGTGYKIWVARDFNNNWNVFRATRSPAAVVELAYNIDDIAIATTNEEHGLAVDDIIVIKGFDTGYDGVYQVISIPSATTFSMIMYQNLEDLIKAQTFFGTGILFKLTSLRALNPYLVDTCRPYGGWVENDKVWVDDVDGEGNWAVYNKIDAWKFNAKLSLNESQYATYDQFGASIAFTPDESILYSGAPDSGAGRVSLFAKTSSGGWTPTGFLWGNSNGLAKFGRSIVSSGGMLAVAAPNSNSERGYVYIYRDNILLSQILAESSPAPGDLFGASMAMSKDGRYLYIGAPGANKVYCYGLAPRRIETVQTFADPNIVTNGPDGVRTKFVLDLNVTSTDEVLVVSPYRSAEYVPYVDYTVDPFTNCIDTTMVAGFAVDPTPETVVTYYSVPATGGTGSGAKFTVIREIGSTNYIAYVTDPGQGYQVGDVLTIAGNLLDGATPANDLSITVLTVRASGYWVNFVTPPLNFERLTVAIRPYHYKLIKTIPLGSEATGVDNFGCSLATNDEGSLISIGAKSTTVNSVEEAGVVYVYHRTITKFRTNGISGTYTAPDNFNTIFSVSLNGIELVPNLEYFIVNENSVQFGAFNIPDSGKVITAETNQFVLDQIIYSQTEVTQPERFGENLAMCSTGCNLYVTSPDYKETHYQYGIVTRFVNIGRVYGTITGTVTNPTVAIGDSIIINSYPVVFSGTTLVSVVNDINEANLPGITAAIVDNKLRIASDVKIVGDKLNVLAGSQGTAITDLGLSIYKFVQTIRHLTTGGERFGSSIAVNTQNNMLAIGSNGADSYQIINFDQSTTVFDSTSTEFGDYTPDSGSVYVYNLMVNPYQDEDSPSLFVLTQKLAGPDFEPGINFGASIGIISGTMIVGAPSDSSVALQGGILYAYSNPGDKSGWDLIRFNEPRTDISAITSSFLYNSVSQNIVHFFDILDPAKGKILGIVDQELDYKEDFDPASYNTSTRSDTIVNTNFYWATAQVGRTWWDLSKAAYIDYEQGSLQYRINNWGELFPGSQIVIYEWVESSVLPSQHVANNLDGIPKYDDDSAYTSTVIVDPATGIITQKYYYWVYGKTEVNSLIARRTLSTTTLESYILNSRDQGIPYIAPISTNSLSLYNIGDHLSGTDIVLHIDKMISRSSNLIHNEYQIVQQGNPNEIIPPRIIGKFRDSLVGFDSFGRSVPDPALSVNDRLGVLTRPRQSVFVNRLPALEIFVTLVNNIFQNHPVLLITTASTLYKQEPLPTVGIDAEVSSSTELSYLDTEDFPDGYTILISSDPDYNGKWTVYRFNGISRKFDLDRIQSYKTSLFWESTDWYDPTILPGYEITYTLNRYADIQIISPAIGDYIKILNNGNDQWLIYQVETDRSLRLIAAQNATVKLSDELYNTELSAGFDSRVFDLIEFDPQASVELLSIFDSIYNEIFIKDLSIEINNIFFALVNYIFTEQKNPDWIFKTSFIDVFHRLRTLEQIPNYTKDNQNFYADYINEVKPYRTKVKEYIPSYDNLDLANGGWSDFDLPSTYNPETNTFKSPENRNPIDALVISSNELYKEWNDHYRYKVVDFIIGDPGTGYTFAPAIEIIGGGGTGATATASVDPLTGEIEEIVVTNPGSGYTSTPTIKVNGVGSGAKIYPVLKNEFYAAISSQSYNLVRSIDTQIKFDRVDYQSNLLIWDANTIYSNAVISGSGSNIRVVSGNIVVYNNEAYLVTNANVTADTVFDFSRYSRLDSGNALLKATDRIKAYYVPGPGRISNDFGQLMTGIDYPGTKVTGEKFDANSFSITSDIIGFTYTGLSITSANTQQLDFLDLGFDLNQQVKVQALVPFDFANNGTYKIVSVDHGSMMLTGAPIEPIYTLTLSDRITANVGDYITQANSVANAWVTANVVSSRTVPVIYSMSSFENTPELISINGIGTTAYVQELQENGTATVNIQNLYIDDLLDSNIYSTYTDTALGTRPEDINIVGGAYVDTYNSHAPEELIPGRTYDTLEMRVFTNNSSDTATYGFRVFHPMSRSPEFTRISANNTTILSANLAPTDSFIFVEDISKLPDPSPELAIPGVVFINGERIHYYQRYTSQQISGALPWSANTSYAMSSFINVDLGTLYTNVVSNVAGTNFTLRAYQNGYTVVGVNSNVEVAIGNVYTISGNLLGGASTINDATVNVLTDGLVKYYEASGNTAITFKTYKVLGNVYANSNAYINTNNIELVYANTLAQLRRGVDGTGIAPLHQANSIVADSSLQQIIPNSTYFADSANLYTTGNVTTTGNVSYALYVFGNVSAQIGDYITQANNVSGNARVLANVSPLTGFAVDNIDVSFDAVPFDNNNFDVLVNVPIYNGVVIPRDYTTFAVEMVSGTIIAPNSSVISINGVSTTAFAVSFTPLGTINANGNVNATSIAGNVSTSNLWVPLGTGVGLENSTLEAAEFIRLEPSYIP